MNSKKMDTKSYDSMLDRSYRWNWQYQLKFELSGFFGSLFYRKNAPISSEGRQLLHLGCGGVYLKGFVNADFYFLRWLPWRNKSGYDWLLDFRKPFKCPDNVWDGVFSEHTIEHLHPSEAFGLFKELYRTMKTGAVLRICVPGLDEVLDAFSGNPSENGKQYLENNKGFTRAVAIFHLTQNYYHLSVWDYNTFNDMLTTIGFRDVKKLSFREGKDPDLLQDLKDREIGSMYIEAIK